MRSGKTHERTGYPPTGFPLAQKPSRQGQIPRTAPSSLRGSLTPAPGRAHGTRHSRGTFVRLESFYITTPCMTSNWPRFARGLSFVAMPAIMAEQPDSEGRNHEEAVAGGGRRADVVRPGGGSRSTATCRSHKRVRCITWSTWYGHVRAAAIAADIGE